MYVKKKCYRYQIFSNELPIINVSDKLKIVDVLALVDNEYVHIELNTNSNKYIHMRNFIYFTEIYSNKTKRGNEYNPNTPFIHIDLSYGLKNNNDVSYYYVQDKQCNKYVDNFSIIEFNMDLLKKNCYTKDEFKYLIMLDMDKHELEKYGSGAEFMMKYKNMLEDLNKDYTFRSAMTYEEDQRMILKPKNTYLIMRVCKKVKKVQSEK